VHLNLDQDAKTMNRIFYLCVLFVVSIFVGVQGIYGIHGLGTTSQATSEIVQAKPADDFVERIQGMAHLHHTNSSYNINWDTIGDNLGKSGIRYLRRVYTPNPNMATQDNINRHHYLHDNYGIRFQFQVNYGFSKKETTWSKSALKQNLEVIKRDFPDEMIARLEGPNEAPFKTAEQRQTILGYQTELYKMVKQDPTLKQFPVVCFSTVNLGGLNLFKNLYQICDIGNVHSYPAHRTPAEFVDDIQKRFAHSNAYPVKKPMVITEEAYGDKAIRYPRTMHRNANVQAKYEQRLLLLQYEKDMAIIGRSQLADTKPDKQGGKFSHIGYLNYDGSPKPVYYAIRNLLSLLGEAKWDRNRQEWLYPPNFIPNSLDYDLIGNTANIKQLLFQKSDGRFFLVLWQEVEGWDHKTNKEIEIPNQNLTLQLNTPTETAKVWLPYNADNPSLDLKPISIRKYPSKLLLAVPDYPVVIELSPK
jgi:hypothetical protein